MSTFGKVLLIGFLGIALIAILSEPKQKSKSNLKQNKVHNKQSQKIIFDPFWEDGVIKVYMQPSKDTAVLTTVRDEKDLIVLKKEQYWYKVNAKGLIGWVKRRGWWGPIIEDIRKKYWDVLELKPGQIIRISKETPVVPEINPKDPYAAMRKIVRLKQGSEFKILKVHHEGPDPWYYVVFITKDGPHYGWVNSIALLGQDIQIK